VDVLTAGSLEEALAMKAERPDAVPIAGGTDVMVAVNFGYLRPPGFLDLTRVAELDRYEAGDGSFFLGAGVSYARVIRELPRFVPLVQASRSVGSPQIRVRATIGGNLGTASPAGDALPPLACYEAEVVVASAARGERSVAWNEFFTGPKRAALEPDELILGARWRPAAGAGSFSKVGTRNAMVISVASVCLVTDEERRVVRLALGSVGPVVLRAPDAEAFAAGAFHEAGLWADPTRALPDDAVREFGRLVGAAARPIDDQRGSAAYRRHACEVLARRALTWAVDDRRPALERAG
jgi:CO/xanthine dehydrogenase FAD-binding subunit